MSKSKKNSTANFVAKHLLEYKTCDHMLKLNMTKFKDFVHYVGSDFQIIMQRKLMKEFIYLPVAHGGQFWEVRPQVQGAARERREHPHPPH